SRAVLVISLIGRLMARLTRQWVDETSTLTDTGHAHLSAHSNAWEGDAPGTATKHRPYQRTADCNGHWQSSGTISKPLISTGASSFVGGTVGKTHGSPRPQSHKTPAASVFA